MKIRTQFIISTAIFGTLLLVIFGSVMITNQRVDQASKQEKIARSLEQEANELSYLSSAYLLYRENQQLNRWESKYATMANNLACLEPDTPEQRAVVKNIEANQERMKAVFAEVRTTLESASRARGNEPDPAFIRVSWSRLEVQNQGIIFDASRLAQMLRDRVDQFKQTNIILIMSLLGVFGAYILSNYLVIYRHTLRSLSDLQAGTKIIGSGNLDFAIAVKRDDEIGELSNAFNLMTASLKEVTASKADMEREIAKRKRADEEIKLLNESLSRRAAELEVSNKELEAFSYSVSHDLRAPLRHIDGFSEILLEDYADQLDSKAQRYLQLLREGSQKMGQLIDALLKLSRVTRVEMRRQPVDLSDIAQSTLARLQEEQPERQVELTIEPLAVANGDPQLLSIALENLFGNAWKFTSIRPVAQIEFGVTRDSDKTVYFVKDNGAGFDMLYAGKLFGAFQRLHTTAEFPGTGVGLATVQRIVHRHGGRVWAEGKVDEGATFYFTLE